MDKEIENYGYKCTKCGFRHYKESKIFEKHLKYMEKK